VEANRRLSPLLGFKANEKIKLCFKLQNKTRTDWDSSASPCRLLAMCKHYPDSQSNQKQVRRPEEGQAFSLVTFSSSQDLEICCGARTMHVSQKYPERTQMYA